MQQLLHLLNTVRWERVVVALLHSLWQGAILAAVVWALLRGIPAKRARLRYGVALAGLLGTVIAAMATFHCLGNTPAGSGHALISRADASPNVRQRAAASPSVAESDSIPATAPGIDRINDPAQRWAWAASLWCAGTILMLVRAGWLLVGAGRLLRGCRIVDDPRLTAALEQSKRSMRILRPVRLAAGPAIRVPAVLGMVVPVVLLPLAAMNDMPVAHLRMILAHELAHVRRHDYLVNLMQLLVEALLFFNPAVWWLSREVRREREACCDAMAVAAMGSGPEYVQSLAEVLAALVSNQPGLRLTPALTGDGGIVDRARRVLVPGHRPELRLPWYSLIGMTAVAVVLLAGMWRGTQVAVLAAERLMTPAERVEKMAKLQDELGPKLISEEAPADRVELAGSIRTEDGKPLPPKTQATAVVQWRNSTAWKSLRLDSQGRFSLKVEDGQAQVWVESPGYAPALSEPLRAGPNGQFPAVELVLGKGFDGTLHLTDTAGKPVPNAKVTIEYLRELDTLNSYGVRSYTTDAQGTIVVHHAADRPAQLTADLHGYEYDRIPTRLQAGADATVRLTPAKLTSGIITDAATHQPLAAATVALLQRKGFDERTWSPHDGTGNEPPVVARTDEQGRFTLDTLRGDSTYVLWIATAGHASQMLQGVRAGQTGLEWALGPAKPITVEIHADAARMPKKVEVENPLQLRDSSYSYGFTLPVHVKDGIGTAVLADPIPGTVIFSTGGISARVSTDRIEGPAVIDLTSLPKPQAMRDVVVKLDWPKDGAAPRGKLRVDYIKPESPNNYTPAEVELKDGQATISVPVPTQFGYSQGTVAGYWIDDKHEIPVPAGNDPLVIAVPADPAGAIHGTVLDENGKPFTKYFYVSLVMVKPSSNAAANQRASAMQPFNSRVGSGRYLLSPLPLGGTYQLIAGAGARLAVSEEFTVAAEHPIRSLDLEFTAGVTLSGTILGPAGERLSGLAVQLDCSPLANSSFQASATTDRDGRFAFEHVEPRAGDYMLSVKPGTSTQGIEMKHLVVGDEPMEIRLKPGLSAKGRIVDVETGKAMANVTVALIPKDARQAQYPGRVEAVTDPDGGFEALGLEPIEYTVMVPNTYEPNAKVLRDADAKVTGVQETASHRAAMKGGQGGVLEIKRMRSPWR